MIGKTAVVVQEKVVGELSVESYQVYHILPNVNKPILPNNLYPWKNNV